MKNEVAERYGAGLFELAKEENKVEEYMNQVLLLKHTLKENPELSTFFLSVKVSKEEKRNVIDKVYSTYVDHNIVNFIKLVVDKGRATQLLNIYTSFIRMCEEDLGIQHATVLSARKLSQEDMNTIGNTLVSKTNKRIILENVVDPSIIAGIKVTVGNTVTDVTMKTKIDRMRNTLLKGGQMA